MGNLKVAELQPDQSRPGKDPENMLTAYFVLKMILKQFFSSVCAWVSVLSHHDRLLNS